MSNINQIRSCGLTFTINGDGVLQECSNFRKALKLAKNEQSGFYLRAEDGEDGDCETVICWSE